MFNIVSPWNWKGNKDTDDNDNDDMHHNIDFFSMLNNEYLKCRFASCPRYAYPRSSSRIDRTLEKSLVVPRISWQIDMINYICRIENARGRVSRARNERFRTSVAVYTVPAESTTQFVLRESGQTVEK